jgi:hypothetical protein
MLGEGVLHLFQEWKLCHAKRGDAKLLQNASMRVFEMLRQGPPRNHRIARVENGDDGGPQSGSLMVRRACVFVEFAIE